MSVYLPRSENSRSSQQIDFDPFDETWPGNVYNLEPSPAEVWVLEDENEVTIQSKREHSYVEEAVTQGTARAVRVLDESAILPGEASYATVKLNHETEQSSMPKSVDAEMDRFELPTSAGTSSKLRQLDESQVLSGEASYATVMLNEPKADRSYSPLTEFRIKTNMDLRPIVLATGVVLAVLICASAFLIFKVRGNNSTAQAINSARQMTRSDAQKPSSPADEPAPSILAVDKGPQPTSLSVKDSGVKGLVSLAGKPSSDVPNKSQQSSLVQTERSSGVTPSAPNPKSVLSNQEAKLIANKRQTAANKRSPSMKAAPSTVITSTGSKESDRSPGPRDRDAKPSPAESPKEPAKSTTFVGEGVRPRRVLP